MKKILCIIALILAVICTLASCEIFEMTKPNISVSDDGYVVVNGVKTEYEVKNKTHSFGSWKHYNKDETDCENKLYYRICSDCSTIEWKEGKYDDHDYNTETDDFFHWQKCENCDNTTEKVEHTLGDDGICTVCDGVIGETEGIIYDLSSDGAYAIVIGYSGNAKRIKIAKKHNGVPVKEIYNEAFKDCSITSVIIPDSITSIGYEAFSGCSSLSSVVVGDSVTSIGYNAFNGCHSSLYTEAAYVKYVKANDNSYEILIDITNSDLSSYSIHEDTKHIASLAFYGCAKLTSINIPDSVTSIGANAFSGCSSLSSIAIPNSVTGIDSCAFSGCSSLSSIAIPDSVTGIGSRAFYYCSSLSSVVIPDSVTSIGNNAFSYCSSLTDVYYTGSEEEWNTIEFNYGNSDLKYATIHYNYVPEE